MEDIVEELREMFGIEKEDISKLFQEETFDTLVNVTESDQTAWLKVPTRIRLFDEDTLVLHFGHLHVFSWQ